MKDFEGALAEWDELIERNEEDSLAWLGRFDCLFKLERKEEMLQIGEKVCEYFPESEAAHNNFACLLLEKNEFEKAARYFDTALALAPEKTMYYFNAGLANRGAGRLNQAAVCFEHVLAEEPEHQRALEFLSQIYLEFGLHQKVIDLSMRLRLLRPGYTLPLQRRLYCMMNDPAIDEQEISVELALLRSVLVNRPSSEQNSSQTRIAWIVCPYSLRFLHYVMPALRRLKPEGAFQLIGICANPSIKSDEYEALFDETYRLPSTSPKLMQELLSAHPIDVLIDTMGQVPNNLVQLYSVRLAPLQISWPFYHVPLEMILMDYALVDEGIRPEDKDTKAAPAGTLQPSDKLVYMESGQFFYELDDEAPLTPSPVVKNNYVTFGVCADPIKINPQSVACWAQILKKVPDAKLKFFHSVFPALICEQHLVALFIAQDIEEERIEFQRADESHERRFEPYSEIDVLLSPFPVTDDLHLIDALWMGCPVIALEQGVRGASRAGSVLASANQTKFLLRNEGDYVNFAAELAGDNDALIEHRNTLREEIRQSPLTDVEDSVSEWYSKIKTLI